MFLDKSQKNKYTIGKVLRKLKHLRKSDPTAKQIPMPPELQEYYDQLVSQGLQVNGLRFALFETTNGLKYPGLIACQKILSNTVLVKVPVQSLLTTREAFLSDIQKVFVQNPAFFAKRFTSDWEDRIILAFLLYEYQKGKQSRWYHLIRNLPKDIDYAVFWTKEEIDFLEDEWIGREIGRERQRFDKDCEEMMRILKNYPEYFEDKTLSKENIIWLHTHLVTRCFGKYFEYTTMVPFAELFNHECVDVYYTMYYKPGNPHDQKQEFYEERELTEQEMDECESSDGSYDAEDFLEENEYIPTWEGACWQLLPDDYGAELVKDIRSILYHMYTFINFSDSLSLHYIALVLRQLAATTHIKSWQGRKAKCEQVHLLNVQYLRRVKQYYKKIKRKYYSYAITQKQKAVEPKPADQPQEGVNYFEQPWPKDKFDEFYMLCSTKDQFQKGSQVFFCYGRLPNKLLLMRYGIALQHNKYDHMFIKIEIEQEVKSSFYLRAITREIQIKKYQRFKIKRTKMCVELVTYFRMRKWSYGQSIDNIFSVVDLEVERQVLQETKQFYFDYLSKYKTNLETNEKNLHNSSIGYHKYFGLVYKTEQQRLLRSQIQMVDYALEVIEELKKRRSLQDVLSNEESPQKLTYQIMMEVYFRMIEAPIL